MNRRGDIDAIVVGAGAIGGAIALALARDGFAVALIEAREPKSWCATDDVDPRVVALATDARDLLADLHVWRAIETSRAGAYRHMHVWDASAPGELHLDAAERGEASLGWIVENKLIQHTLWQAVTAEPAVRVLCPAQVAQIENAADAVTATLDDGTRLRARVLIAAEGAQSSVRDTLGIPYTGRDYGQRAVVAHVGTERPHQSTAWQRFQPGGPLAFLPLADGRCSVVWSLPDAQAARVLALDDAAFCAELGCAFDFRLGTITSATPRAAFPLRLRLAGEFVSGRCLLAGDTAHLVHPLAGQGMNVGLRDARALRVILRDARARDGDIGATPVLRRYARERRSQSTLSAYAFDAIERVFGSTLAPVALLRGAALATAGALPPLRMLLMDAAAGRY
ncbi:MAG: UbiH/UbiF/VisC/COQ6 family ubiquinone biosynthesis hydroxylase [Rhodanobacter sp.]|jgi:2-octaprenyl-3-methyl-6-methoxy-1,4-benzoquinol hydroxylase/2-octaprenylphenol hydroxylase|nr:UbiH/UbiF/VisC/COQ6 family ubiquinone biosynthesis hydroxylase [Rhodanobacter sp.]